MLAPQGPWLQGALPEAMGRLRVEGRSEGSRQRWERLADSTASVLTESTVAEGTREGG